MGVHLHLDELVIVEPCPLQAGVIQLESQRFYQMQSATGVGTEANDISRVGRYFRLIQCDVEQRLLQEHFR